MTSRGERRRRLRRLNFIRFSDQKCLAKTRKSYYVQVRYEVTPEGGRGGGEEPPAEKQRGAGSEAVEGKTAYVAAVQYFVRLPHPIHEGEWMRLAICDYYYHPQPPITDADTRDVMHAVHHRVNPSAGYVDCAYATPLDAIDTELVGVWRPGPAGSDTMLMYFTTNPGASGHIV